MSSANAIKAVSLLIELTQLAAEIGLSMQDLVNRQKQVEAEGREFGEADLEALRAQVDENLTDLENS